MENNNRKTIKLTESELHQLIQEAVVQCINEGKFGDFAKKVGKGLGKAAIGAGIGLAGLGALDRGLENQYQYQQNINKHSRALSGPTSDEVKQWCIDHGMNPDDPHAIEQAYDYLDAQYKDDYEAFSNRNESKRASVTISESKLSQIIRDNIRKVLA